MALRSIVVNNGLETGFLAGHIYHFRIGGQRHQTELVVAGSQHRAENLIDIHSGRRKYGEITVSVERFLFSSKVDLLQFIYAISGCLIEGIRSHRIPNPAIGRNQDRPCDSSPCRIGIEANRIGFPNLQKRGHKPISGLGIGIIVSIVSHPGIGYQPPALASKRSNLHIPVFGRECLISHALKTFNKIPFRIHLHRIQAHRIIDIVIVFRHRDGKLIETSLLRREIELQSIGHFLGSQADSLGTFGFSIDSKTDFDILHRGSSPIVHLGQNFDFLSGKPVAVRFCQAQHPYPRIFSKRRLEHTAHFIHVPCTRIVILHFESHENILAFIGGEIHALERPSIFRQIDLFGIPHILGQFHREVFRNVRSGG